MLEVQRLTVHLQQVRILEEISFHVAQKEIVAIIGSNGAGKTTLLRTLSGLIQPTLGRILFEGKPIEGMKPHHIVRLGLSQIPERGRVFPHMTVLDHLYLGAWTRRRTGPLHADMADIYALFPVLEARKNQLAGTLSGGERQMIAIARALMSRPKLLILDEPTLGLSPLLCQRLGEIIENVNRQGTTVLLVEQDALLALSVSHRGYVMETGKIALEGASPCLIDNQEVRRAYLGMDEQGALGPEG
jgi:branched-chain amino acid transport system ATP-binding protein